MKFQRIVGVSFLVVIIVTCTVFYKIYADNGVYCSNWAYVSSSRSYALNNIIFIGHITPPGYYEGSGDAAATVGPNPTYGNTDSIWLQLNDDGSYETNEACMEAFGGRFSDKYAYAGGRIDSPLYVTIGAYAFAFTYTNSDGFEVIASMYIGAASDPTVSYPLSDLPYGYHTGYASTVLRGTHGDGTDAYSRESVTCWIQVWNDSAGNRQYTTSETLSNYTYVNIREFYSASAHGRF
ncbi:hypothetical protein C6501_14830 [Candidatus Poribacteria bacterium]|nr:MAG: hypothetical protein C6501_14830 [Candidatus Poribacteria bacterium]